MNLNQDIDSIHEFGLLISWIEAGSELRLEIAKVRNKIIHYHFSIYVTNIITIIFITILFTCDSCYNYLVTTLV